MKKKSITELTEQELLNLAEQKNENTNHYSLYRDDVLEFCTFFKITPGQEAVAIKIVYDLYKAWSLNPVNQRLFTNSLQLLFPEMNKNIRCYFLNLTRDEMLSNLVKNIKIHNKTKSKISKEHFDKFLSKYSIQTGTFFVKDIVLYNLYDKWTYETKKQRPLSLNQFQNFCRLYFKFKFIETNWWYGVNQSIIRFLSEEMIHALKNKKVSKYAKQKTKQKNKLKISSS